MPHWLRFWWYLFLLGLFASILTCGSLAYRQPARCDQRCTAPANESCPTGTCRPGEQQAGFPFFMARDRDSESPPSGWGHVDLQDYTRPNVRAVGGNLLVYSVLVSSVWLLWQVWTRRPTAGERNRSEDQDSGM